MWDRLEQRAQAAAEERTRVQSQAAYDNNNNAYAPSPAAAPPAMPAKARRMYNLEQMLTR
jgi:hypothetical protein